MKKGLKILAASDIHGDTTAVKSLAKKAKEEHVDLVILAGDLTQFENSTDNLIGPFTKEKKPVLVIHGNHESIATIDFLSQLYADTKNIHGYSVMHGDVGIFGCGGANFGNSALTEKQFFETLKKAHEGVKNAKKKIMVTHMHPEGSLAEFSGFSGNKGIRKALLEFKPDVMLSGHIHEAEGIEEIIGKTRLINLGKRGTIIEL